MVIEPGLYLVATPIGNLDDITIRALNILKNSNLILCENTINSKKLLNKYGIKTKINKYTDHDFERQKNRVLDLIKKDKKTVAIISDSGSPLISDPGSQLINYLFQNGAKVISIPGPSALIAGIQLSGFLNKKKFSFLGFLPKKNDQKINIIRENLKNNLIIYSTKQQIEKDIDAVVGLSDDYEIIIMRELTKIHEERIMVNPSNIKNTDLKNLKGEIILAVTANLKESSFDSIDAKKAKKLIDEFGTKKAYQVVKTKYKISRNEFYKFALELKDV
tara:strand:- start:999 stop:1826 length:828 start_codon:yes stop_codon:yes gene_type:complete